MFLLLPFWFSLFSEKSLDLPLYEPSSALPPHAAPDTRRQSWTPHVGRQDTIAPFC